jgi:hypothetical protein
MKMTSCETPQPAIIPNRLPAPLASDFDKSLLSYAAAAAAAGVGLLALSQSAEAKIVFTPSNIPIPENAGLIQLDINHDGIPDFAFSAVSYFGSARAAARPPLGAYSDRLTLIPDQAGNEVGAITSSKGFQCAAKLPAKVAVGPGRDFKSNLLMMFQVAGDYTNQFSAHCPWVDCKSGFLGLKFVVNGETHYGWARISQTGGPSIRGYAYETVPNQPILTGATTGPADAAVSHPPVLPVPQPASLSLLANGVAGLMIWRRPEEMQ